MSGGPRFSVIVPTRGRPGLLREAVASVLAQDIVDFECLVVDDAGPDEIEPFTDPRVRVIRREVNGGAAAARNTGVAQATGTYLAFLDDDDLWTPNRLALALGGFRRAPLVVCWSRYLDEDPADKRHLEGNVHDTVLDDTVPHLGSTAIERARFVPFDERYRGAEDAEWWLRVSSAVPVTTVPVFANLVRRHPGVRHGSGAGERLRWNTMLLRDHADYFAEHARAASFRWRRAGLTALAAGDQAAARRAMWHALRARPTLTGVFDLTVASSPSWVVRARHRQLAPDTTPPCDLRRGPA